MTQARWPSSVGAARSVSRAERAGRGRPGRPAPASGSAHDSAFWTSGSASPMSWPSTARRVPATSGSRPVGGRRGSSSRSSSRRAGAPSATGSRRAARARPSGTARRRCPCRTGGRGVDGDPVAGLAGGPAQELPGPLGLVGEGPLEQPEGEPARLEVRLAEQAVGEEQEGRRALAAGRVPEAARDGRDERPADAVDGADARARRAAGPRGTRGRRGRCSPRSRAAAKPSGSLVRSARSAAERLGRGACARRRRRQRGRSPRCRSAGGRWRAVAVAVIGACPPCRA